MKTVDKVTARISYLGHVWSFGMGMIAASLPFETSAPIGSGIVGAFVALVGLVGMLWHIRGDV